MKVFLLILFLSQQDGSITGAVKGGPAPSVIICQENAAQMLEQHKSEIPAGVRPMPVCIDTTRVGELHVPNLKNQTVL
ncbi:MAG TPA: hypothetical protein VFA39_15450 [Steroidobacteraceae bacterium]|nr:hypothetical protein [Steroidobacteraceae bacterium]